MDQTAEVQRNNQTAATGYYEPEGESQSFNVWDSYGDAELIIGLVGAVGTNLSNVVNILTDRLTLHNYTPKEIHVSKEIIQNRIYPKKELTITDEYDRINRMMDLGDQARKDSGDDSFVALGIADFIQSDRKEPGKEAETPKGRQAYIIRSLKHPDEVQRLRQIYPLGFYLLGVYSSIHSVLNDCA